MFEIPNPPNMIIIGEARNNGLPIVVVTMGRLEQVASLWGWGLKGVKGWWGREESDSLSINDDDLMRMKCDCVIMSVCGFVQKGLGSHRSPFHHTPKVVICHTHEPIENAARLNMNRFVQPCGVEMNMNEATPPSHQIFTPFIFIVVGSLLLMTLKWDRKPCLWYGLKKRFGLHPFLTVNQSIWRPQPRPIHRYDSLINQFLLATAHTTPTRDHHQPLACLCLCVCVWAPQISHQCFLFQL